MSNQYDPGQAPTATFPAVPGPAQPEQEQITDNSQPDGTSRYTSNGFTSGERARRAGGRGPVYNWFTTGDSKLDPNSEQGRKLAPAMYDGWSIAGLCLAVFVPIVGLVLSIVAFAEAKKNHRRVHGTAIGGLILSALGCIGWTLYWIVLIFVMVSAANAVSSYPSYGG